MAFVAVFTRSGVTPSVAVTAIASAFGSLIDPTDKASAALAKFGTEGVTGMERFKQIVEDEGFAYALQSLVDTLGTELTADIFTRRGEIGIFDVTSAEDFLGVLLEIRNASGELDEAFEAFTTTAKFQFDQLKANLETFGITIFGQIKGPLGEILTDVNEFIKRLNTLALNNPELVKMTIQFALMAAAVGPLLIIFGNLFRSLGTLISVLAVPLKVIGSFVSLLGTGLRIAMMTVGAAALFVGKMVGGVFLVAFRGAGVVISAVSRQLLILANALRLAVGFILGAFSAAIPLVTGTIIFFYKTLLGWSAVVVRLFAATASGAALMARSVVVSLGGAVLNALGAVAGLLSTVFVALGAALASLFGVVLSLVGAVGSAVLGVVGTMVGAFFTLTAPIAAVAAGIAALIVGIAGLSRAVAPAFERVTGVARSKTNKMKRSMRGYGKNIVEQFGKGMLDGLIAVVQALQQIGRIVAHWLKPGSPPRLLPDLTNWGSGAASAWMDGWTTFDYSAIQEITGKFRDYLSSMFASDDTSSQIDVLEQTMAFRDQLAEAINEINSTGNLSVDTWESLAEALSETSDAMRQFVALTLEAAEAQEHVQSIQDQIDDAQSDYESSIAPLNDRLEEIRKHQEGVETGGRLNQLQQIMNDPRASKELRDAAALEFEAMQIEMQLGEAEDEYQGIIAPLEEQLAAARENLEIIQAQLALAQAQVDYEIEGNNLLEEIRDLIKQGNEGGAAGGGAADELGGALAGGLPEDLAEWPELGGEGGGLGLDFDPTGDLDAKLQTLREEFSELGEIWSGVWSEMTTNVSTWWTDTAKPAFDEFIAHPFVQETFQLINDTITTTLEKFDEMKPATEDLNGLWETIQNIVGFVALVGLSALTGLGAIVENMGAVFGVVLGHLNEIGETFGPLAESVGDWLEGLSTFLNGDEELGSAMMTEAQAQVGSALADVATTVFDAVVDVFARTGIAIADGILAGTSRLVEGIGDALGVDTSGVTTWLTDVQEEFDGFIMDTGNWGTRARTSIDLWWSDLWDNPQKDWEAYYGSLETEGGGISTWWAGISTEWNEYWLGIGDNWQTAKDRWAGDWETFKASIQEKGDALSLWWSNLKTDWTEYWQGISDNWTTNKDRLVGDWEAFKASIQEKGVP